MPVEISSLAEYDQQLSRAGSSKLVVVDCAAALACLDHVLTLLATHSPRRTRCRRRNALLKRSADLVRPMPCHCSGASPSAYADIRSHRYWLDVRRSSEEGALHLGMKR
jgi:hypothetical protein